MAAQKESDFPEFHVWIEEENPGICHGHHLRTLQVNMPDHKRFNKNHVRLVIERKMSTKLQVKSWQSLESVSYFAKDDWDAWIYIVSRFFRRQANFNLIIHDFSNHENHRSDPDWQQIKIPTRICVLEKKIVDFFYKINHIPVPEGYAKRDV